MKRLLLPLLFALAAAPAKVKILGPKFDLVPTKVKDSDVLGLSTEGCVNRPYYVVQWREAAPGTILLVK